MEPARGEVGWDARLQMDLDGYNLILLLVLILLPNLPRYEEAALSFCHHAFPHQDELSFPLNHELK